MSCPVVMLIAAAAVFVATLALFALVMRGRGTAGEPPQFDEVTEVSWRHSRD